MPDARTLSKLMNSRLCLPKLRISAGLFFVSTLASHAVDFNNDGLSDLWQLNYGAQNETAAGDPDGDGFSNAEEAIAGTNPFSATSTPALGLSRPGLAGSPLFFDYPTEAGKFYQLTESADLLSFEPFGPIVEGDGGEQSITLQSEDASTRQGRVLQSFWSNVAATDITDLTELATFPSQPDGQKESSRFEITPVKGDSFGGRLVALITPPESGSYTFALSSGSPAKAYLSTDTDSANFGELAEVFSSQTDITPNEWDRYSTQRSAPVELVAGEAYLLEVHYLSSTSDSHCQMGWTGPGIINTAVLTSQHLAPLEYLAPPSDSQDLLVHDYDAQASVLWPNNTELITAPEGMAGNAERFTGDPGNQAAETLLLPQSSSDHFYATWLFRMSPGHDDVHFFFQGPGGDDEEGPRVNLEERNNFTTVAVRTGGTFGVRQIDVEFDTTYRVELVASLETPFPYQVGLSSRSVAVDTFDLYITDTTGRIVGSERGLTFKDPGDNVVGALDRLRAASITTPNIVFDSWEITDGRIAGNGVLKGNISDFSSDPRRQFFQLRITDRDQDGDGLTDWEELLLARHQPFLFFDAETRDGTSDLSAVGSLLSANTGTPTISLAASDTAAFENNSPNAGDDFGSILLTRSGTLAPVVVNLCIAPLENTGNTATVCNGTCCSLVGSAGDEAAEVEDYTLYDSDGRVLTDTVSFALGEMTKTITVVATPDLINEYPETLNIAIAPAGNSEYEISSSTNGASIQLFDLPENPANNAIFTGTFSRDGRAVTATSASGFTTAILNGPRTRLLISNEFSNLTSEQQDSHVHKSNPGPTAGDIIYAVTEEPGGESLPEPASLPLLGPLDSYPWDLTASSGTIPSAGGAASKQAIIDSLFGQNGETPLYFNLHTVDNPAGEVWAFLNLTGGSILSPGAPTAAAEPGSAAYPQLAGQELSSEVRRFLNQATFGATEEQVLSLTSAIVTERQTNPDYHRHTAYQDWLSEQMAMPQSYLLDYHLAHDFQHLTLNGLFDPVVNPPQNGRTTPERPSQWPVVDRSNPDPERWHLSAPYPFSDEARRLVSDNGLRLEPSDRDRRHAHWQMMLNARDQLRQKAGFALQQIVVVSAEDGTIRNSPYAASNYQDQLNARAFAHYRDVLGFVNWSPLMGRWLSSLQNQKGIDLDGDGVDDISPDENLARENMQLFSIGLFDLWPDGTLRLGPDGAPNNTYTNDDIREFAKVLTGQSFGVANSRSDGWGGIPFDEIERNDRFNFSQSQDRVFQDKYCYPMQMFGEFHDRSIKTFAGVTIDNTDLSDATEQGIADIEDAIDWLAGKPGDGAPDFDGVNSHGSTPAFISLRLIQRFTTSNPSRDYLHRVATTFQESEGNLAETVSAILLDAEARVPDLGNDSFGLKKSPMESFIEMARALEGFTELPLTTPNGEYPYDDAPGDFSDPDLSLDTFGYSAEQLANQERNMRFLMNNTVTDSTVGLQMAPFRQPTVFNWYQPDYAPSGPIADAGLVSPELQLANEPDVIRNLNYQHNFVRNSRGHFLDSLGGRSEIQRTILGNVDNSDLSFNDNFRIDSERLALRFYPAQPETDLPPNRTAESVADEALVDALDERLTLGYLARKYPYDPSDDDDPTQDGVDDLFKNPRELIIDAIASSGGDPFSGNNDLSDRAQKLRDALYLLTASPEFQIKK